jgi:hypothetical protein
METIKNLARKKKKVEKEMEKYYVLMKFLQYSHAIFYVGIMISIVYASNLLLSILIVFFIFVFFKLLYSSLQRLMYSKKKRISNINHQIFLQSRLKVD